MNPAALDDVLTLTDADGTLLGAVVLDAADGPLVLGTFRPGPGFERVSALFREFEEHVEAAALGVLPDIERRIAALGLQFRRAGEPGVPVDAVQIYSDGGFSCRPVAATGAGVAPVGRVAPHADALSPTPGA